MNWIFFLDFTFFCRLYFLLRGIIMNPNSFFTKIISLIRDFTISFANLLFFASWELIYYLFGNSLLIYHISHRLSVTRNHYEFIISHELIHVSWYFSGNHYGFIISRELINFFLQIDYLFDVKILWIHYLFRKFTLSKLSLRDFTINSQSLYRIYYEFNINIANFLWIHYLFRQMTINSLSFPESYYEFTHRSHEFTLN